MVGREEKSVLMRDRGGSLVLPRYNNAGVGSVVTSPTGSQGGGGGLERGDSILLDIEGGGPETGGESSSVRMTSSSWLRTDMITSPFKTAVFTHLGSAVSSGWSRAYGTVMGSSITSYIRRVPALEKPFDLNDIHHPRDPNDI